MLQTLRASWPASMAASRWRLVAGLAIMLFAVVQSAANLEGPRLQLVGVLAVVMLCGWLLTGSRHVAMGVWLLGGASCAMMLVAPGNGAVIGVIAAIVTAGMRLPVRQGAVAAAVLGPLFVMVDLWLNRDGGPVGSAFLAIGLTFAYLATSSVRRIRLERERAEALLAELERTRAGEIERAALAERSRIAREIHDVLAHTLSSLAVQLEGTRLLLEQRPGDPAAVVAVERAHRLASEGLAEARRAVGALRGDHLPGPDGLQRLVDEFGQETGTPSHFEVSGQPTVLGPEAQLALYRTAQEALTNVRKHAQAASSVDVRLSYAADGAELLVEDAVPVSIAESETNGTNGSGYGLVGMRERAELVGGTLEAGPLPTGYRVRLWLPTTT
jgi:signal transduction histidine kinase